MSVNSHSSTSPVPCQLASTIFDNINSIIMKDITLKFPLTNGEELTIGSTCFERLLPKTRQEGESGREAIRSLASLSVSSGVSQLDETAKQERWRNISSTLNQNNDDIRQRLRDAKGGNKVINTDMEGDDQLKLQGDMATVLQRDDGEGTRPKTIIVAGQRVNMTCDQTYDLTLRELSRYLGSPDALSI
jgi:hypothetical protein